MNTDLLIEVAEKSKRIWSATIYLYEFHDCLWKWKIGEDRVITKGTPLTPDNFYGDSKKQAEIKIRPLEDENFKIVIVRPPMIYGPHSKGNYPLLAKFAKKTPYFLH